MYFNPRLASKLSEAYSNGDVSRSFGGDYLNTYTNNSFNNFRGDENQIMNNVGSGVIDSYNANPEGQQQQMRFNEISSQVLQEQQAMQPHAPNKSLIEFANNFIPKPINETKHEIPAPSPSPVNRYDYMPYSVERRYNNGELTTINKNTAMLVGIICVIGFMMFMLIQLYMSQKRVEYIVSLYRDIPLNSPYFTAEKLKSLNYDNDRV